MFGRKKKVSKAQTDEEMLLEALGQMEVQETKRAKMRGKRFSARAWLPAWLEGRVVAGILVILVIIIADGVRRENEEFVATLTGITGTVTVAQTEEAPAVPATINQKLVDDMVVRTGAASSATIEFPDGSASTLDQNSALLIKLMEYSRAGRWRTRSFYLLAGRMWSNVGQYFGPQSEMKIHTPSAVAAVRGTQYAVSYDPAKNQTIIQCNDGYVTAEGFTGQSLWVGQGGQSVVGYGAPPSAPDWMSPEAKQSFAQEAMYKVARPPSWIKTAELTVTQIFDAPLSILGIGKCSWARGAADFARLSAAMTGLRYIMQFMEGYERYPAFVNPATLEELSIPYKEARRILLNFDGEALAKYECLSGRSYRITVRARDKRRTTFIMTPTGIERVKPESQS